MEQVENRSVEQVLYAYYRKVDAEFAAIASETVGDDAAAIADHKRRYEEARAHVRDAKYAWERARDLSLQPSI